MFDTYRKKVIALVIGSLLFLGLAYQFSIADTLAQKKQYEQSQKLLADLGSGNRVAFNQV